MIRLSFNHRPVRVLAAIVLIALLLRLVWAFGSGITPDFFDQGMYNEFAVNWIRGQGLMTDWQGMPSAERTPLYPVFLAAVYWVGGVNNYRAVFVVQALLGTATVVIIYLLGER